MTSAAAAIPQHAKNHLPAGSDPLPITPGGGPFEAVACQIGEIVVGGGGDPAFDLVDWVEDVTDIYSTDGWGWAGGAVPAWIDFHTDSQGITGVRIQNAPSAVYEVVHRIYQIAAAGGAPYLIPPCVQQWPIFLDDPGQDFADAAAAVAGEAWMPGRTTWRWDTEYAAPANPSLGWWRTPWVEYRYVMRLDPADDLIFHTKFLTYGGVSGHRVSINADIVVRKLCT